MLGLDRRAARATWTVAVILLLLGLIYMLRQTIFIFILALLLAYLLWPLVNRLNRYVPGRSRTPALAIVYLVLVGLLIVAGIEVGSRVIVEANTLGSRVPELISRLQQEPPLPAPNETAGVKATVLATLRKEMADHSRELLALLPKLALSILAHAGSLVFIVLVPILSFFFLKDGEQLRDSVLQFFSEGYRRDLIEDIAADLHVLLAQYIRALVLLACSSFAAWGLFLSLADAPYALLLAAIAFPLEFIPMIGPLTATVLILLVTGLSGYHHLLWILIFAAAFRFFQDYVLSPQLMAAGVQLHPLLVIFGVLAGGYLGGIAGSFLSVPVLAALRIVYRRLRRQAGAVALQPRG
jgi:predicted PurR-regulated permease PerM